MRSVKHQTGLVSYNVVDLQIFQAILREFQQRGDKDVLVVWDIDDFAWPLTLDIAKKGGIDPGKATSVFSIRDNPLLSSAEKQYIIDEFSNAENFRNIRFYDGIESILRPRELGAKVVVNSNSFSEEISKLKTEQLLATIPGLTRDDIQMNTVNYAGARSKRLNSHITFLGEDSPHNISQSDALCSVVPSYMTWSVCPDAVQTMVGKRVVARDSFAAITQFVYNGTKYILEHCRT